MDIKTKFEIGDTVFALYDGKIYPLKIGEILIQVDSDKEAYVSYKGCRGSFSRSLSFSENEVFKTKEELLSSIKTWIV